MVSQSQFWTSTAGSMAFVFGAVPIAEAFEVLEPFAPPSFQQTDPLLEDSNAIATHLSAQASEVGLSFELPHLSSQQLKTEDPEDPQVEVGQVIIMQGLPAEWWQQGSDSPIAIAIGMAEGTRTVDGGKTAAYYWHEDPGNGANNFGTFSYQHLPSAKTAEINRQSGRAAKREVAKAEGLPELSDRLQLKRLQQFSRQLQQQAQRRGIELTALELLNGLDLANQSEEAALATWGYIDRLAQMRSLLPNQEEEQIKEARAWSYWSPERNTWDAPGLGNTYENIQYDQNRRFAAVKKALQVYGKF